MYFPQQKKDPGKDEKEDESDHLHIEVSCKDRRERTKTAFLPQVLLTPLKSPKGAYMPKHTFKQQPNNRRKRLNIFKGLLAASGVITLLGAALIRIVNMENIGLILLIFSSVMQFILLSPSFHEHKNIPRLNLTQQTMSTSKSHPKTSKVVPEKSISTSTTYHREESQLPLSLALETPWSKAVNILTKLIENSSDAKTKKQLVKIKEVMTHPETMNSIGSLQRLSLQDDTVEWLSSTFTKTPIKPQSSRKVWGNVKANMKKLKSMRDYSKTMQPKVVFDQSPKAEGRKGSHFSFTPVDEHMRKQQKAANWIEETTTKGSSLALGVLSQIETTTEGANSNEVAVPPFPRFSEMQMASVEDYLQKNSFTDWDFDTMEFNNTVSHGHSLWFIMMIICHYYNFIGILRIDPKKLSAMLTKAEQLYCYDPEKKNIYHNHCHAADVALTCFNFTENGILRNFLQGLDGFALLLSAAFHDYRHPGLNNGYMIKSRNHIAITYNDNSVLENFHASEAYRLLLQSEYNILEHFSAEDSQRFRNVFIEAILATDLAQGFEYISKFNNILANEDFTSPSGKLLVIQITLKCADVSHPSKCWKLHYKWSELIAEEFFSQGDIERLEHFPISPLCDRYCNTNYAKSQCDFIDFIVRPCFRPFSKFCQEDRWLSNIDKNYREWEEGQKKPQQCFLQPKRMDDIVLSGTSLSTTHMES